MSGTLNGGTNGNLSYAAHTGPVTLNVSTNTSTGIGALVGIRNVTGSPASDTIAGANQTWNLTGPDAGDNGTYFWTSFENLGATGNISLVGAGGSVSGAISVPGSATLTGGIASGGGQTYSGPVTLGGATTLQSTGGNAINFGSTINGAQDLVIATTGNVALGTGIGGVTPLTNFTVAGALPSPSPSTFPISRRFRMSALWI